MCIFFSLKNSICVDILISSSNFCLVCVAYDDLQMYLVGIVLIYEDLFVITCYSYVICFDRYPDVLSVLRYYYLLYWY
jgi:hypothetical protein